MAYCDKNKLEPLQILYEGALEAYMKELIKDKIPKRISELSKYVTFD
jgi:molybdopterin-guanine dinucleotide biosynthesis protein A